LNRLVRRKYLVAGAVKCGFNVPCSVSAGASIFTLFSPTRKSNWRYLPVWNLAGSYLDRSWILLDLVMSKKNAADVRIDHIHSRAICDEIGERLREKLMREALELPPRLQLLVDRLAELDGRSAPSIVPSFEDMQPQRELHSSSV
jgi:hypothetical protein